MKISPIASPGTAASANLDLGHSAGADRIERAKAVMNGQSPDSIPQAPDPQIQRAETSIKTIRMRTQRSPHLEQPVLAEAPLPETPVESPILASNEQAPATSEATQLLSPQFAALAKEKRALQAMRREIEAQKTAIANKPATDGQYYTKEQLQANALRVLQEAGVSYDQLTEQLLSQGQGNPGIDEVRAEIKALKEGIEKAQMERDQANEQQVLAQIRSDVDQLISQGDEFEGVRTAGYAPKVVELIHQVFKKEGKILDVTEAAQLIENELIEEGLQWARLKKVQGRLAPPPVQQPVPASKPAAPNTKVMRTLTNRDGVSSISMSKRERAIAAMEGRLKT